jgi:hypothetical protein
MAATTNGDFTDLLDEFGSRVGHGLPGEVDPSALPGLVDALQGELEQLRQVMADAPAAASADVQPERRHGDEPVPRANVDRRVSEPRPTPRRAAQPARERHHAPAAASPPDVLAEAVGLGRLSGMLEWLTEDFANGLGTALNSQTASDVDRVALLHDVRANLRAGLRRLDAALGDEVGD